MCRIQARCSLEAARFMASKRRFSFSRRNVCLSTSLIERCAGLAGSTINIRVRKTGKGERGRGEISQPPTSTLSPVSKKFVLFVLTGLIVSSDTTHLRSSSKANTSTIALALSRVSIARRRFLLAMDLTQCLSARHLLNQCWIQLVA